MTNAADPHAGQPLPHLGPEPAAARLTAILVHGRGASADDILSLSREFRTTDVAYLAPEAAGHSWYPLSFLAPIQQNEPWLTSALGGLASLAFHADALVVLAHFPPFAQYGAGWSGLQ